MKNVFTATILALAIVATSGCSSNDIYSGVRGKCDDINQYDITFSRFDESAQQLAHATGCFIETSLSQTGSVQVNPVKGKMSIREALRTAIEGSKLEISRQGPDRITVTKVSR